MKIRNVEVEFDFFDADDVERFEKEAEKVKLQSQNKEIKEMSYSEALRAECKIIRDFFDNVFGEGISEKMFNGKNNLAEHIKAFEDIVNEKISQQKQLNSTYERYMPNRAERRYNQFNRKR